MFDTALHLIRAWGELGAPGLALLAAAFVLGALAFVPRPALCVLGGLVFGFSAMPVALIAATAGAIAAFLLSRHLLRSLVRRATEGRPRLQAAVAAADAEGWRLVVLLRLSPIPGSAVSYLLGLTGIPLGQYAAGTVLGLLPSVMVFVYIGAISGAILDPRSVSHAHFGFLAAGLLAIVLAAWLLTRRAKAILARRLSGTLEAV